MVRKRLEREKERKVIEKGVSPVVAVVLLVLLTLAVAAGVWTFYSNMQRNAEEFGTAGALNTAEKTATQVRLAAISGNEVMVQNRGTVAISKIAVYVDDRLVEPYETPQNIYPGEMGAVALPKALEVGTHVVKVVANGIAKDSLRVEGTELAKFRWRRGLLVKNPTEGATVNSWSGGADGIPMTIDKIIPLESMVIFDQENNEIPFVSSGGWWNPDWKNRQLVAVGDTSGVNRDDIVTFRLNSLKLATSNCKKEIRLVDSRGEVIPFQVTDAAGQGLAIGSQVCEIEFKADVPARETVNYYVYYNNAEATEPTFGTDLQTSETSDEICITNSILKVCLGKDIGAITWLGKADGKNLLAKNSGINAHYSGVQPNVAYSSGFDYSACGPYLYEDHQVVRSGEVEDKIVYDFSTTCNDGKKYSYRYTLSVFSYQPFYQLSIENRNQLNFMGNGYAYIAQTIWARQVSINAPDGGGWSAYKIGDESVGVVPITVSPRTLKDSIRPTNYMKIDDSTSLEPGLISTTRTVYQGAGDPNTRVKKEAVKIATPLVYSQQPEESRPETSSMSINFPVTLAGKQSKIFYVYYSDQKLGIRPYTIRNANVAGFGFETTMKDEEEFRGQV